MYSGDLMYSGGGDLNIVYTIQIPTVHQPCGRDGRSEDDGGGGGDGERQREKICTK